MTNQQIPAQTGDSGPEGRPSGGRWVKIGIGIVSLAILLLSAFVVARALAGIDWRELGRAIRTTSLEQFAAAAAFAGLSFVAWTGYDFLAVRQLGLNVRYRVAALASFTCYSIANTLGFPLVTGGTVRYWIYSRAGMPASRIASLIVIASASYWLGSALVLGTALMLRPEQLAAVDRLPATVNMLAGAGLLLALVAYVVWVSVAHRRMNVRGLVLELPGLRITLAQLVVGTIDILCAAAVLYVLLPPGHGVHYITYAAIYMVAMLLGVASNVPGGLGPFEATMLQAFPGVSAEALLASLLLFRVVYYLIPFVLGLALLGAHEALRHGRAMRASMARARTERNGAGDDDDSG